METSRLTRDGTTEPVSQDQILTGTNADREILFFPVQLTTSSIGNYNTRLIHTLAICVTIQAGYSEKYAALSSPTQIISHTLRTLAGLTSNLPIIRSINVCLVGPRAREQAILTTHASNLLKPLYSTLVLGASAKLANQSHRNSRWCMIPWVGRKIFQMKHDVSRNRRIEEKKEEKKRFIVGSIFDNHIPVIQLSIWKYSIVRRSVCVCVCIY